MATIRNNSLRRLAVALMIFGLALSLGLSHALEAALAHGEGHCEGQCESECDLDCVCLNCVQSKLALELEQSDLPVSPGLSYSAVVGSSDLSDQGWSSGIDRPPQVIA